MSFVNESTCTGTLVLNGVAMNCPAWTTLDLTPFLMPPKWRGQDERVPGSPGVLSMPRRSDLKPVDIPMIVVGVCDPTGATFENPWVGFESNMNYLRVHLLDITHTVFASYTTPSGQVRTGQVQVEDWVLGDGGGHDAAYPVSMSLSLPGGPLS